VCNYKMNVEIKQSDGIKTNKRSVYIYLFICTSLLSSDRYKIIYFSLQTVTYTDNIFCLWFKTQTCFCINILPNNIYSSFEDFSLVRDISKDYILYKYHAGSFLHPG